MEWWIIELPHEPIAKPRNCRVCRGPACAGDADLRQQVEALLRVHDDAGNFFDKLAPVARPTSADEAVSGSSEAVSLGAIPTEKAGDRIGRYKLLEQIGEGGCGVVYMAEQEEPVRRRVALKVSIMRRWSRISLRELLCGYPSLVSNFRPPTARS